MRPPRIRCQSCRIRTYSTQPDSVKAHLKYDKAPSNSTVSPASSTRRNRSQTFYQNRIIESYLEKKPSTVTLRTLIFFGKHLNEQRLIQAGNYVRKELPTRIAHRIRDFQQLPFVVGTNRHIEQVYDLYWSAFDQFRKVPEIKTMEDNDAFCEVIKGLLKDHLVVIPQLTLGIMESSAYFAPEQVDRFMNTMLRSRISRRVLAEQHIALTQQLHSPFHFEGQEHSQEPEQGYIGVVYTHCNAQEIISRCATFLRTHFYQSYGVEPPQVIIDGHTDTTFAYIPDHMEYIFYEVLKNSMRYTIERFAGKRSTMPPIQITITSNDTDVIVRVSDQAGGISPPDAVKGIFSWSRNAHRPDRFANFEKVPRMAATMMEQQEPQFLSTQIAKAQLQPLSQAPSSRDTFTSAQKLALRPPDLQLGIGLPMSRVYAEYWGGGLNLVPMENWGTDTYVRISRLGNREEVVEA